VSWASKIRWESQFETLETRARNMFDWALARLA
jgi:hypothetical protein